MTLLCGGNLNRSVSWWSVCPHLAPWKWRPNREENWRGWPESEDRAELLVHLVCPWSSTAGNQINQGVSIPLMKVRYLLTGGKKTCYLEQLTRLSHGIQIASLSVWLSITQHSQTPMPEATRLELANAENSVGKQTVLQPTCCQSSHAQLIHINECKIKNTPPVLSDKVLLTWNN